MTRQRRWTALGLLLPLCLLAACRNSPSQPNVLMVVVDTLRADRLGAYAGPSHSSPKFDALAARGLLFRRAYSVTSWTNPAVASLFTGKQPEVLQPGASRFIGRGQQTLARAFRDSGYRTAALVASPVIGPELGFADGFDSYEGLAGWAHGLEQRPKVAGQTLTDRALAWIAGQRGTRTPWFLYVHYMDPHWPYVPTSTRQAPAAIGAINQQVRERSFSPETLRQASELYDGTVADVDVQLGRLVSALEAGGQLDNVIVAVTADHGEEFGDHGGVLHSLTLYEEVLHVPLLIVAPAQSPRVIDTPVQTSNIGRTLLELAKVKGLSFPGQSLLVDHAVPLRAQLYPVPKTEHRAAVIDGNSKLIATTQDKWLLFDLASDPGERQDLVGTQPELLARLQKLAPTIPALPPAAMDPALRERMRALGYDF